MCPSNTDTILSVLSRLHRSKAHWGSNSQHKLKDDPYVAGLDNGQIDFAYGVKPLVSFKN